MKQQELKLVLSEHHKWLNSKDGKEGERANLYGANLRGANLRGADDKEWRCDGKFHHLTNVGSENGTLEMYSCGDRGWLISRGCFTGSKDEFISKVKETHGDNIHAVKYLSLIEILCEG